ncbi:preprotein translocase subunit YajC [Nocardioides sp. CER19]|uniref:preprotein translocase subunit YajC n=1 Tax=Nocardioides sp. CER19 TaxID=3038538 RepID=UPI00244AA61D|nr:preprotein translocase subunit YajC [Nocardioides sp. CER19]MDH2416450.1 preprotein translocase subunit YajC [Nocardioides sp. CER19]
MGSLGALLPFVLIIAVFWLLILRPQQRRQRELRHLQSSLSAGNDVMLTSGIFGTVSSTHDDHILVEIAQGVTVKVARGAIAQVITTTGTETDTRDSAEPESGETADSEEN